MTTGQLVFFSGIGLLIVTLILSIIFFIVKKPTYKPENSVHFTTQTLYMSYPTHDLTVALEHPEDLEENPTIILSDETELLPEKSNAL